MNEIMEEGITTNGILEKYQVRSEASKKAWETRRANKAQREINNQQGAPATGGVSAERAEWFKTFPTRLCRKREELDAVSRQYEEMLDEWNAAIDGITAK